MRALGRQAGGVEEPEEVGREVELGIVIPHHDVEMTLGKGALEFRDDGLEISFFFFGEGLGGVGETAIEKRDGTKEGGGALDGERAFGATGGVFQNRVLAVGAVQHVSESS